MAQGRLAQESAGNRLEPFQEEGEISANPLSQGEAWCIWKKEGRSVWLEPGNREEERCELQLVMWTEARSQDFAGQVKDFGFYSKYIRKALGDF